MNTAEIPKAQVQPIQDTEALDNLVPQQSGGEDDDYFSNDPDVIFRREYSKLDTVPLTPPVPLRLYLLFFLMFASFMGGAIIGIVTYPTVTVTIVPLSRQVTYTAQLDVPTRHLAPVTITRSQTATTTGHGYQNARAATGTLTLYNSLFTPQTVYAGTVFPGRDGVKVATSETITIPANNPPLDGRATVSAYAVQAGAQGNIAAGDIHLLFQGILVQNSGFSGGQNARDFQAVARRDLDTLTTTLKTALVQEIPQAFLLRSGETVSPTNCHDTITADHSIGEEATAVTVKATYTCKGIAYSQDELQQKATALFIAQTNPGANYELLNASQPQVVSIAPFIVRVSGTWVYMLSADYEQFLAEKIAGDNPQDAKMYLLRTGFITRATIPTQLPKDPGHIHFILLVEG